MRLLSRGALCLGVALSALATTANAQLTHRYSFTTDGSDSVGSANFIANNGASFVGGQAVFDGVDDYLGFAGNPLPTSGSTTIEVWGTYDPSTPLGSRLFDFATADGDFYLYTSPNSTTGGIRVGWDDDLNGMNSEIGPRTAVPANTGQEVLLTVVLDTTNDVIQLYQGGIQIAEDSGFGLNLLGFISGINDARIGHGVSDTVASNPAANVDPPAFLNGSVNEMRIYSSALNSSDILTNAISGPDVTSVSLSANTWTAGSSSWTTPGNWSGGVPGSGNRAAISNGSTASVTSDAGTTGGLDLTSGTLQVGAGGTLNITYPIELGAGASVSVTGGGSLGTSGVLVSGGAGARTVILDNANISSNGGPMVIEDGVDLNIGAGGANINTAGGILAISAELSGTGDVTVTGGGTIRLRDDQALPPGDQNPGFSGSWHVQGSTVDIAGTHGALGTGAADAGSTLHLEDSTLLINTGVTTSVNFKRVPVDIQVTGESEIINFAPFDNTFLLQGSLTGDGTVTYTVPFNPDPIGIDFMDRENAAVPEEPFVTDNSGFTGRFVVADDTATRFFSTPITDEGGTIIGYERLTDFPNAVFEMADPGAWTGKRGTDEAPVIQLGGVAGVEGSRLEASIAATGDPGGFTAVTYELGGAAVDAEFFGTIRDTPFEGGTPDVTTVVKVGDNTQALSGANSYSGTTTIDGGVLLVNGVHEQATAASVAPNNYAGLAIGDYTVNAGGTLGGSGTIGNATDTVDVDVVGGAIAPGADVGTLTVSGVVTLGAGSTLEIEGMGSTFDKLVSGSLSIGAGVALDVSALGSVVNGTYVIAEFTGALSGSFASVTSGYTVDYGTPGQILLTVNAVVSLPGDANGDGKVDILDLDILSGNFGTAGGATVATGDFNGDGNVDILDLDILSGNFGAMASASAAIPEPTTMLLIMMGLSGLLTSSRKR